MGFSTKDALQFINAADPGKPVTDSKKIAQSRENMASTIKNYLKINEDFLC